MISTEPSLLSHQTDTMLVDVVRGLSSTPKSLPSKYFYDETGSALFDRITELEAYYPTRTERAIMVANVGEMAAAIGRDSVLIEYGSGSSDKTRLLLDALPDLTAYVPIDISAAHLNSTTAQLREDYPHLTITPIAADYSKPLVIPDDPVQRRKRVVYFPGSTIGNFSPDEAENFLKQISDVIGPGGGLLLGVDRKKDRRVLELAYNDPDGVTAAFNHNMLERLNKDLGFDFDVNKFAHKAFYNAVLGRIEMHLVSDSDQTVRSGDCTFDFFAGESIHTENSYKYDLSEIATLAGAADLQLANEWTDERGWFSVLYLTCANRQ